MCGWLTNIDDPELTASAAATEVDSDAAFYRNLARRFREQGVDIVRHLHGAFILAIQDGSTVHISRDGSGNRTVFYARHGKRWLFGIEAKAITALPAFRKRIRSAALAQYLACSFVPGSGTMPEDVYELQAGHAVSLECRQEPWLTRWFRFEKDEREARPELDIVESSQSSIGHDEVFVRRFREEMERAVAERIPRGEPIGVFLSGGLDSSVITAELAHQIGGKNVRTWAIHFGPKYPHELEFARAVAERCGTVHEDVLIQPRRFLPRLRQMVWHLDDPIGDPITQPNFELAAHASKDVRYVFNGDGGDPCFGGPKNIPMMLHHWYGGLDRGPNFRERHYLESDPRAWDDIQFLLSDDVRQQIHMERDLDGVFAPYLRTHRPKLFLNRLTSINIREKGGGTLSSRRSNGCSQPTA